MAEFSKWWLFRFAKVQAKLQADIYWSPTNFTQFIRKGLNTHTIRSPGKSLTSRFLQYIRTKEPFGVQAWNLSSVLLLGCCGPSYSTTEPQFPPLQNENDHPCLVGLLWMSILLTVISVIGHLLFWVTGLCHFIHLSQGRCQYYFMVTLQMKEFRLRLSNLPNVDSRWVAQLKYLANFRFTFF